MKLETPRRKAEEEAQRRHRIEEKDRQRREKIGIPKACAGAALDVGSANARAALQQSAGASGTQSHALTRMLIDDQRQ